ncbi:FtsX-like permease family protein, partial [Micromonospora sp. NPDC049799]
VAVDVSATARRRATELAVLHTLGAGHRLVARSLLAEQAFLAGLGVLVGLVVGIGVAATMAPLVILTPSADRPTPEPVLHVDWGPVAATCVGLLLLALTFSASLSATMRRRLTATQLRIGEDR